MRGLYGDSTNFLEHVDDLHAGATRGGLRPACHPAPAHGAGQPAVHAPVAAVEPGARLPETGVGIAPGPRWITTRHAQSEAVLAMLDA